MAGFGFSLRLFETAMQRKDEMVKKTTELATRVVELERENMKLKDHLVILDRERDHWQRMYKYTDQRLLALCHQVNRIVSFRQNNMQVPKAETFERIAVDAMAEQSSMFADFHVGPLPIKDFVKSQVGAHQGSGDTPPGPIPTTGTGAKSPMGLPATDFPMPPVQPPKPDPVDIGGGPIVPMPSAPTPGSHAIQMKNEGFTATPEDQAVTRMKQSIDENGWDANVEYLLKRCPYAVGVREGAGPEDLKASLVITFIRMQEQLKKLGAKS